MDNISNGFNELLKAASGVSVITVKYTINSIMKEIFKTDKLISKNAQLLFRSGSKSALHRFM